MAQNVLAWAMASGAVLAFWIYGLLFGYGVPVGPWFAWGLVGFAVGGAVFAIRYTSATMRLLLVAGVGAVLALLILGAILQEEPALWASFITALGSSVLMAALPAPAHTAAEAAA